MFSIFKDAERYSSEAGIELIVNENTVTIIDNDTRETIPENYQAISKKLKSKLFQKCYCEVLSSEWQGVNLKQRLNDENVERKYFDWLAKWRTCSTEVVHEFFLLFYQMLPTKVFKLIRCNEIINNTRCRICNISEVESVKHLINNCEGFAHGLYKIRHDNALKCFVWPLLFKLGLTRKQPKWYAQDKVDPYYENGATKFWWDVPEYTGRHPENVLPPRPDGKLLINKENIFARNDSTMDRKSSRKYNFNKDKYRNILLVFPQLLTSRRWFRMGKNFELIFFVRNKVASNTIFHLTSIVDLTQTYPTFHPISRDSHVG